MKGDLNIAIELAAAHLANGGILRIKVNSRSMSPAVRIGDYLHIRKMRHFPRIGDILMVNHGGVALTHRLWKRDRAVVHLQGDASYFPDQPLSKKDILGVVVGIERNEKYDDLSSSFSRCKAVCRILITIAVTAIRRMYHGI